MKTKGKWQALVGASMVVWFFGSLIFGLFGQLVPRWQKIFSVTPAATGSLMMVAMFAMGLFNPISHKISDKRGTQFTSLVCACFALLAVLGFTFAPDIGFWVLYPSGILLGFGGSFAFGPGLTCVQKWWPPQKAGTVSGIFNFFFAFAAVVMIPIFNGLINGKGYMIGLIIITIITFVGILICSVFTAQPEMKAGAGHGARPQLPGFEFKEALSTKSFWFLFFIWGISGAAGIGLVTHIIHMEQAIGFTPGQAVSLMLIFNLCNALIRLVVGQLGNKVNPKHLIWPILLIAGIFICFLTKITNFALAAVALGCIGMTMGVTFTLMPVLVRQFFGMRAYGAIFGIAFSSFCFVSALLGPFVGGMLCKTAYEPAVIEWGVCLFISTALTLMLKPPKKVGESA